LASHRPTSPSRARTRTFGLRAFCATSKCSGGPWAQPPHHRPSCGHALAGGQRVPLGSAGTTPLPLAPLDQVAPRSKGPRLGLEGGPPSPVFQSRETHECLLHRQLTFESSAPPQGTPDPPPAGSPSTRLRRPPIMGCEAPAQKERVAWSSTTRAANRFDLQQINKKSNQGRKSNPSRKNFSTLLCASQGRAPKS